jgi:16S rRNA A1518/A1519 N6-dimethyltransferase RsmA/KsgA/DIM1 with predicted DNA glycosylase/AP lyase activity
LLTGNKFAAAPFNKTFSICDSALFNEANKTLSSYLKQLVSKGKIAETVHKVPNNQEDLRDVNTLNPLALLQTAWFLIAIYFGKRGKENQSLPKKSMLRLV